MDTGAEVLQSAALLLRDDIPYLFPKCSSNGPLSIDDACMTRLDPLAYITKARPLAQTRLLFRTKPRIM